jgi:RNA polymerase sigma factor (sigma-70 family)
MNPEPLESLLEQLCQGNLAVAQQLFMACEPHLRKVVRQRLPARLQAKFDSADIVQSVWADLLHGYRAGAWHFADLQRFQAFLVQVTRNRFNDKFRKHRIAFEKEQRFGGLHTSEMPHSLGPQAADVLEAEELWEQILANCAPEHQELLRLKRQGLPMDELAARTGLHPGSIRRILRNLARKLALGETIDGAAAKS